MFSQQGMLSGLAGISDISKCQCDVLLQLCRMLLWLLLLLLLLTQHLQVVLQRLMTTTSQQAPLQRHQCPRLSLATAGSGWTAVACTDNLLCSVYCSPP
jgi:hypothetical protein